MEDDEQRTVTVEDDEQRTATVEDDEQRSATMEDDEQRSTTTPGRAELQIDEQRFRLASFNRRALLQVRIAFSIKKRERKRRGNEEMER